MKKYTKSDKFVLSSSCKVVKGIKRSILLDYQRTDVRIISNDYADLIERLDRQLILKVKGSIDKKSHKQFDKFLDFLISNEFGIITNDISLYPIISDENYDDHFDLIDGIIELHRDRYIFSEFKKIIDLFDDLSCISIQIRVLSKISNDIINEVLRIINETDISYIEIHLSKNENTNIFYHRLINDNPKLTEVFLYESNTNETVDVINEKEGHHQISLGNIHFKKSALNHSICGVINFNDLTFTDLSIHNLLKRHNGCLYKKLTIDSYGNVKNCPSMKSHFGHFSEIDSKSLMKNDMFKFLWSIKKDDVNICKDCEFRYNCTDCRAFVEEPQNTYSKPLKCGYNPYTNKWEDWSKNPLKLKAIEYYEQ